MLCIIINSKCDMQLIAVKQIANYSTDVTVLASFTYHCTVSLGFSIATAVSFDMKAVDKGNRARLARQQGDMAECQRPCPTLPCQN